MLFNIHCLGCEFLYLYGLELYLKTTFAAKFFF
jgi:hypothetical protein